MGEQGALLGGGDGHGTNGSRGGVAGGTAGGKGRDVEDAHGTCSATGAPPFAATEGIPVCDIGAAACTVGNCPPDRPGDSRTTWPSKLELTREASRGRLDARVSSLALRTEGTTVAVICEPGVDTPGVVTAAVVATAVVAAAVVAAAAVPAAAPAVVGSVIAAESAVAAAAFVAAAAGAFEAGPSARFIAIADTSEAVAESDSASGAAG